MRMYPRACLAISASSLASILAGSAIADPIAFNNADGYFRWTSSDAGGGAQCNSFFPFPAPRLFDVTLSPIQSGDVAGENAICCLGIPPSTGCSTATQTWTIQGAQCGIASANFTYPFGCCGTGCSQSIASPQVLAPGDVVGPSRTFTRQVTTASASLLVGNAMAIPVGPQYVGVKLRISGNTHYGWIRVERRAGRSSFPEYDMTHWGYNTTPNAPVTIPSTLPPPPVIEVAQTIFFQSGLAPVGQLDPNVFTLSAATNTQFGLLTDSQCLSAQSGPNPTVQNLAGEVLAPGAATPTSGLYALPFTLPPSFGAFTQARLVLSSTDALGASPFGFFPALGPRSQDYFVNCVWRGDGARTGNDRELREAGRALHAGVNYVAMNVFNGSSAAFTGRVEISPDRRVDVPSVFVHRGGTVQLSGTVVNSYDPNFTWSVPGGPSQGSINATGLYTAPNTPGVYTVRATSHETSPVNGSVFIGNGTVTATCPSDFNNDGNLDPDDLGDFITCFFSETVCPGADFNQDGNLDPDDLGDFITAFFDGTC